jgi:hypothetical protein
VGHRAPVLPDHYDAHWPNPSSRIHGFSQEVSSVTCCCGVHAVTPGNCSKQFQQDKAGIHLCIHAVFLVCLCGLVLSTGIDLERSTASVLTFFY